MVILPAAADDDDYDEDFRNLKSVFRLQSLENPLKKIT